MMKLITSTWYQSSNEYREAKDLSNAANEGLLTDGFFLIPSLSGPTTIAAKQIGSGTSWLFPYIERGGAPGEHEVMAAKGTNLGKGAVIDYAYNFMKRNVRQSNRMFDIPHKRMLKVGLTYQL
ncbi:OxaA/YidC-like membrane insertion protein [Perilla frutescens var. hirtella]|nr:OxaA/YidC-like membrane insertion protein [Perilla frutescens var. hirtella]